MFCENRVDIFPDAEPKKEVAEQENLCTTKPPIPEKFCIALASTILSFNKSRPLAGSIILYAY
jgi:hypothetical protein